jgi:hypothetical protein
MRSGDHYKVLRYWPYFVASGSLGIVVNFASLWIIKTTSSLFSKLLVTVRGTALVVYGISQGDIVTTTQAIGYSVTAFAFLLYSYFKQTEQALPGRKDP